MSFNFKDVKEADNRGTSPFLSPGGNQILKINDITLKESTNTHKVLPVFHMESKPVTDPEFKGQDGAKGQVGRISGNAGYYLKDDNQQQQFLGALKSIARALNKVEELEEIKADTFEDMIAQAAKVLRGGYARYFVAGSEFPKDGGKYGVKLSFPSRNFVESAQIEEKDSTLPKFDRSNDKHYKAIPKTAPKDDFVTPGAKIASGDPDDLPF